MPDSDEENRQAAAEQQAQMQGDLQAVQRVVGTCLAQSEECDVWFAKRPKSNGGLEEGEANLLMLRRRCLVVLRAIRDSADAALKAVEEGPAAQAFHRRFTSGG